MSDIVAALDRWLETWLVRDGDLRGMIGRARDEIVMLREWKRAAERGVLPITFRADVLEEAAQACERIPLCEHGCASEAAATIRALKEKP